MGLNTKELGARRVLIMDDDPSVRLLMWYALRNAGFQVAVADHPREAEERMRTESFDVLVTDHHMPYETGLSFIRRMRTGEGTHLETHKDIPVVMISSYNQPDHLKDVAGLGVGALIQKPFRLPQFADTVRTVVNNGTMGPFIHVPSFA